MARSTRTSRPGLAHADRRELRLVRSWLESPAFARAMAESCEAGDSDAEALVALAQRAGVRTTRRWKGYRNGDRLVFREQAADEPLALVIESGASAVRLAHAGEVDAGGEVEINDIDDAVDGIASPVLAWLRSRGERPSGASRLAALFEPRRRGAAWPSSPH